MARKADCLYQEDLETFIDMIEDVHVDVKEFPSEDYKMIDMVRFMLASLFHVYWWNDIFWARETETQTGTQIRYLFIPSAFWWEYVNTVIIRQPLYSILSLEIYYNLFSVLRFLRITRIQILLAGMTVQEQIYIITSVIFWLLTIKGVTRNTRNSKD